jgi:hypothetical protein
MSILLVRYCIIPYLPLQAEQDEEVEEEAVDMVDVTMEEAEAEGEAEDEAMEEAGVMTKCPQVPTVLTLYHYATIPMKSGSNYRMIRSRSLNI